MIEFICPVNKYYFILNEIVATEDISDNKQ